ncbi:MAG: G/U mismatch-specific DNA glycosylase [Gemmatimonadaceae bacterium]
MSRVAQQPFKPTREQLAAAAQQTLPDLIAYDLRVLFCGINPGLYTTAIGHHFGRPGNRFWPALHGSGFTPALVSPWHERELLKLGLGITNVVSRTTATAAELSADEYVAGGRRLRTTIKRYRPKVLAVLGVTAYRSAFGEPKATLGLQLAKILETSLWVIPNPSGLNANYQLPELIRLYGQLREWVDSQ